MMFRHLEWFALLPVLLLAGWLLPRLSLWRPVRLLLLVLITVTLAQPQWRRLADGVDLWVLLDSSTSAEQPMAKGMQEGKALGDRLSLLETKWEESDYALTKEELLSDNS